MSMCPIPTPSLRWEKENIERVYKIVFKLKNTHFPCYVLSNVRAMMNHPSCFDVWLSKCVFASFPGSSRSLRFSHRYRVGFSSRSRQASKNCQKFQNNQQAILATKLRPQIEKATVWRNSASKKVTPNLSPPGPITIRVRFTAGRYLVALKGETLTRGGARRTKNVKNGSEFRRKQRCANDPWHKLLLGPLASFFPTSSLLGSFVREKLRFLPRLRNMYHERVWGRGIFFLVSEGNYSRSFSYLLVGFMPLDTHVFIFGFLCA